MPITFFEKPAELKKLLLKQCGGPFIGVLVLSVISVGLHFIPEAYPHLSLLSIIVKVAFTLIIVWLLFRFVTVLSAGKGTVGSNLLIKMLLKISVASVGALIILDTLGISITPILASLGVGSVAVALALQDTLGNLFSGFYLLIDKPIRVGDFIRTQDGIEGTVRRIGWRSTQILGGANTVIVVPNSKLSSAVITNFDLTERETALTLMLSLDYGSDLEKAERVLKESTKEVIHRLPEGVKSFEPLIRFHSFGSSSLRVQIVARVTHVSYQSLVRHEIIKEILNRFKKEGISIPSSRVVIEKD